jgi:hypothetical protein
MPESQEFLALHAVWLVPSLPPSNAMQKISMLNVMLGRSCNFSKPKGLQNKRQVTPRANTENDAECLQ